MAFEQSIARLVSLIDSDSEVYGAIFNRLLDGGIQEGIGYLGRDQLSQLLTTIILPSNLTRDRGWQDSPRTSPGVQPGSDTMNGVSLDVVRSFFDSVFINTEVQSAANIAQEVNQTDWRSSEESSSLLLFTLCASDRISSLFYLALAGSALSQYALRVMTVDPCAGYLLAQWTFESSPQDGSHFTESGLANLRTPTGAPNPFPSSYATSWTANPDAVVDGGGARFSAEAIKLREQWIERLTSPVDSNPLGLLQQSWKARLNAEADSQLATLIRINEQFNLNSSSLYSRTDADLVDKLTRLGQSYKAIADVAGSSDPEVSITGVVGVVPTSGVTGTPPTSLDQLLSIRNGEQGKVNTFGGRQLLLSSDRIILNTRTDYLMLFGGAGVAISSPGSINIDAEGAATIFGEDGVFLGLPNKGNPVTSNNSDLEYEPLVLGSKLSDLIEDLILTLRNATILGPTGAAYFAEDTLDELAKIQARLPEIMSTYAYVDGQSYESRDPQPESKPAEQQTANPQSSSTPVAQETTTATSDLSTLADYYVTNPLYQDPI